MRRGIVPKRPRARVRGSSVSRRWTQPRNATHWSTVTSKGRRVHIEFLPPKSDKAVPAGPGPVEADTTQANAAAARQRGPKKRCGLCEMEFTSDNLPGIVTRRSVMRLRERWMSIPRQRAEDYPAKGAHGDGTRGGAGHDKLMVDVRNEHDKVKTELLKSRWRKKVVTGVPGGLTPRHKPGATRSESPQHRHKYIRARIRKKATPHVSRLYDPVPLCVFCSQMFPIDNAVETLREQGMGFERKPAGPHHPSRKQPARESTVKVVGGEAGSSSEGGNGADTDGAKANFARHAVFTGASAKQTGKRRRKRRGRAANTLRQLNRAATIERKRNPPVPKVPDASVLASRKTPIAADPTVTGPVNRGPKPVRKQKTETQLRRERAAHKSQARDVASAQLARKFRHLGEQKPGATSRSSSPAPTVAAARSGSAVPARSPIRAGTAPVSRPRANTATPSGAGADAVRAGAAAGPVGEDPAGLYAKHAVVVPGSTSPGGDTALKSMKDGGFNPMRGGGSAPVGKKRPVPPTAPGGEGGRVGHELGEVAEDNVMGEGGEGGGEGGSNSDDDSDSMAPSRSPLRRLQEGHNGGLVDVDDLARFGFKDFCRRVAEPPALKEFQTNLTDLRAEYRTQYKASQYPLAPSALFRMRTSEMQEYWPSSTVEPDPHTTRVRNAYLRLLETEQLKPKSGRKAMQEGMATSRKRATGREYRADAARHVVRRSDKAKFGVSLAPHSPGNSYHFGTRTQRTHQPHWTSGSLKGSRLLHEQHIPEEHRKFLNTTYGLNGLVGAGGVVVGPYTEGDLLVPKISMPPDDEVQRKKNRRQLHPHPHGNSTLSLPNGDAIDEAYGQEQSTQVALARHQSRHMGQAPQDSPRAVAGLLANWDEEDPPSPGNIEGGNYRPGRRLLSKDRTPSSSNMIRSARSRRRMSARQAGVTHAEQEEERARQDMYQGRSSPPGLGRPLSPADGAVQATGLRRPGPPRAITPVLEDDNVAPLSPRIRVRELSSRGGNLSPRPGSRSASRPSSRPGSRSASRPTSSALRQRAGSRPGSRPGSSRAQSAVSWRPDVPFGDYPSDYSVHSGSDDEADEA